MTDSIFHEKHCSRCGKEFISHGHWAYRSGSGEDARLFCSWGCMRAWEKEKPTKMQRREKIIQAVKDGLSVNEISKLLNEEPKTVWYWKNKLDGDRKDDE